MASSKRRGAREAFSDEIWEWAADLAEASGREVQVSLHRAPRVGVWRVSIRVLDMADNRPAGIYYQDVTEWPNSHYSTLLAHVFARISHVALRIEEHPLARRSP